MDQQTLREFEAKCIQDEAPACQSSCPIHLDARTIAKLIASNNLKKARIELDKYMPLSMLCAFLCEGDCKKSCKRGQIGEAIDMPMLERFLALNTEPTKAMVLPSNSKKVAIAGSSLSSLCLASEMAKKGYAVQLFHVGQVGAELITKAGNKLRSEDFDKALNILSSQKVKFAEVEKFDNAWLSNTLEENLIVYLGEDDSFVSSSNLDIEKVNNSYSKNPVSLTTSHEKVVAGGYFSESTNFCKAMADSKKAMGSIVRILQKVSPDVAREAEAPYETRLFTNLKDYAHSTQIICENTLIPTLEEASNEAKRCIQCSCLECVKECTYMQNYKTYPKRALREAYNNLAIAQGNRAANTMINSCTQCGLCAKICPNGLNLGDFMGIARKEMVKQKRMPPTAHEFALEDMAFSNSKDVQFYRKQNVSSENNSKYVFFPGCQLPAVLPKELEKAYSYLTQNLDGDVALHLACCGMPASWANSTKYLENHVECIKKEWEERGKPVYIFACASCQSFYNKYIPEMEITSLWEVLAENLYVQENTTIKYNLEKLALHDPCNSREFPKMQESVRSLTKLLGQEIAELEYGKENTRCCGFGGLSSEVNQILADTFADERNKDTNEDLLVYCAICRERMQKVGKKSLHILELLFPVDDVVTRKDKALLSIFERQEKRLQFRKDILKSVWNEEDMENQIDIEFNLLDGLDETLSQRRILSADIARVLQDVEQNGASFYSPEKEEYLACYRPKQVSYWVKYSKKEGEPYLILDAYSHRMVVPGVSGEGALPSYTQFSCCDKG